MINLSKGGRLSLSKDENGNTLHKICFGANWGAIQKKGFFGIGGRIESVDLDASVVMMDAQGREVDVVYYAHKRSDDGSIRHSGDDLTGDTDGDDGKDNEVITVDLDRVSSNVDKLYFILNSFRHHKFDEIPYMGLHIYSGKTDLAKFNLDKDSNDPDTTFVDREAMVLGYAYRKDGEWKFKACGNTSNSRSIAQIIQNDIKNL